MQNFLDITNSLRNLWLIIYDLCLLQMFSHLYFRKLSFIIDLLQVVSFDLDKQIVRLVKNPVVEYLLRIIRSSLVKFLCFALIKWLSRFWSYQPKAEASDSRGFDPKISSPMDRAREIQANLASNFPSFVKKMLTSHVAGCFRLVSSWLLKWYIRRIAKLMLLKLCWNS